MKETSVNYHDGVLEIQYASHTKICEDIASARIELERIIRYRSKSVSQKKFWYYAALADMVRDSLNLMTIEYELKHFKGIVLCAEP